MSDIITAMYACKPNQGFGNLVLYNKVPIRKIFRCDGEIVLMGTLFIINTYFILWFNTYTLIVLFVYILQ